MNRMDLMETISEEMEQVSPTGSKRKNAGKSQISQLSPEFINDLAGLMTKVAESGKYKEFNWAKGQMMRTAYDSCQRHLLDFYAGEDIDQESGQPHLLHAAANIMFLYHTYKNHPQLDDRPEELKK
jgi:hypothetical protein